MFSIDARSLGYVDVAVCGGGIAGVCAAVTAARNGSKVMLIEAGGCLGGTMTEGTIPYVIDRDNKGGIVRELYEFLEEHEMCCPRRGDKADKNGKRIPGAILDIEGAKYFFDKICREAGVRVLFHSRAAAVNHTLGHINKLLISTECGLYFLEAKIYIDATGGGNLSCLVGCEWECGEPSTGKPSPASVGMATVGFPEEYNGTDSEEEKTAYGTLLEKRGIRVSSQQASIVKLPSLKTWDVSVNFQYDVMPDDIFSLSNATYEGRRESFDVIHAHRQMPGYENLSIVYTSSHIGIREGRRIQGVYRITDEDIIEGRRFDDGICLVTASVDVHKLNDDDTLNTSRGYRTKPYHIPYRSLLPKGSDNILLAGKCISGDFYPFSSYRMMGNMAATGVAAGYAASLCVKEDMLPREVDGKRVKEYMWDYLHERN